MSDEAADVLNRLLALIPLLRQHEGVHMGDLAELLGRPEEEVRQDFHRILMCGTPPYYPDDYVGVVVEEDRVHITFADHFTRPIRLTLREALALRIALETLPPGGDQEWQQAKHSLISKIDALLAQEPEAKGRDLQGKLQVSLPTEEQNTRLHTLQKAVREQEALELSYYSAHQDRLKKLLVNPYGLVESLGRFYLVCRQRDADRTLTLRVDRIQRIEPLGEEFDFPEGFSLDSFQTERMYIPSGDEVTVCIRFDASVARWIQEEFHEECFEIEDDDSLVLEIDVRPDSAWLRNWVLQYGDKAEILEPESFREAMREHLSSFLERSE